MSQTFLNQVKAGAIQNWHTHQILPSLTAAQAGLESGWGTSALAKAPNYNLFGIKASADFAGAVVNMQTREYGANGSYMIYADFRRYDSWNHSVSEHGQFFTSTDWRVENYKAVVGEKDYKKAAWALQNAPLPYATDPQYATKIINIIEKYNLQSWDREALESIPAETSIVKKEVGGTLTESAKLAIKNYNVTLIGDSLGVGTNPKLQNTFKAYNADVLGSRQITHATDSLNGTKVLQNLKNAGTLKDVVVVILGTNRGVTESEIDNLVSIAGSNRKVIFVDTASQVNHKSSVSSAYKKASQKHINAYYANWSSHSGSMFNAYYGADKIHMTDEGYSAHASFIKQAVYEASVGIKTSSSQSSGNSQSSLKTEYIGIEDIDYNKDGLISRKGESIIYNPEANKLWGDKFGDKEIWSEYILEVDSDDPQFILTEAVAIMKANAQPSAQYTVDMAEVHGNISIGDTGIYIDHHFNPPLYIQARVLEIQTSETDLNGNKVVIGNVVELFPKDKSEILKLQKDLQDTRDNLVEDYRKGEPIELTIESTNGELVNGQTQLIARAFQGTIEVTERFHNWVWERDSHDSVGDAKLNDILLKTNKLSHLTIYEKDMFEQDSVFRVSLYDNKNENIITSTYLSIKLVIPPKSAYDLAVLAGFTGSLVEWIESLKGRDGSSGVKGKDGTDGTSSYTHIAYSNSSDGALDFSTEREIDIDYKYFGIYVDSKVADSQNHRDYTWLLFKGSTTNFYIAYADSEDGKIGFSINDSLNKKFIGTYSSTNQEQSTDPTHYRWMPTAGYAEERAKDFAAEQDEINAERFEQEMKKLWDEQQDYQFSLDKTTTIYRGIHAPLGMKANDLWYRPHPTKDGETQMVIYNGELWEILLDTSGESLLTEQIAQVDEDTKQAKQRADDAFTKAQTNEDALIDKVGTEEFGSTITQIETDINLRVTKDDVVNQINVSDEGILIDGSKVIISGDTTVDGSFKVTNDMIASDITADKIVSGTINAAKVDIINMNADNITAGRLDIGKNLSLTNGAQTILNIDDDGEVVLNISKMTINAMPQLIEDRINEIELTPGAKGETGRSVERIEKWYLLTKTDSSPTIEMFDDWTQEIPKMNSEFKYLWNVEVTHFSDTTTQQTKPFIIGVHADEVITADVYSMNGDAFKNGIIDTWVYVVVKKGNVDITDQITIANFKWTRTSSDLAGDQAWNDRYAGGVKEVHVTDADVKGLATFECLVEDFE